MPAASPIGEQRTLTILTRFVGFWQLDLVLPEWVTPKAANLEEAAETCPILLRRFGTMSAISFHCGRGFPLQAGPRRNPVRWTPQSALQCRNACQRATARFCLFCGWAICDDALEPGVGCPRPGFSASS